MKTLYDVLGARPNDDAVTLKGAFRKAAKANHPDLNAGDPDAPVRFLQIVRAKSILGDPELRALYDQMLDYERQLFQRPTKLTTILDAIQNIVSNSIAVIVLAVVLAAVYTLFTYLSEISRSTAIVIPPNVHESSNVGQAAPHATISKTPREKRAGAEPPWADAAAAEGNDSVADPMQALAGIANVGHWPPFGFEQTASDTSSKKLESEASVPNSISPTINGGVAAEAAAQSMANMAVRSLLAPNDDPHDKLEIAKIAMPSTAAPTENAFGGGRSERFTNVPLKGAKFYLSQGIASYRKGEVPAAIADFDLAIRLDPNLAGAYVERAVALYRIREVNRAFADIAQARRIEKSRRNAISTKVPRLSNNGPN